jgi:hypothetical protein
MGGVIHPSKSEAAEVDAAGAPAPPIAGVDAGAVSCKTAVATDTATGAAAAGDAILPPAELVEDRINDFTRFFCADILSATILLLSSIIIDGASTPRSEMYCSNAFFNVSRARDNGPDMLV